MHTQFEASTSQQSGERRGRWSRIWSGGRDELSREALEREAAAELGLGDGPRAAEPEPTSEPHPATDDATPSHRGRKPWSRLRDVLSTESDAAWRERLEREAAEELGLSRPPAEA